jgi:hypothetical protein
MPDPETVRQIEMVAAIDEAVRRHLRAPHEFAGPRNLALPASKNVFPKLVTLDMRHWIELARQHYGRASNPVVGDALAALRTAVNDSRAVVAVTDINIAEASKSENVERRKRMAAFMVDLSRNYCLISHTAASVAEARSSLRTVVEPTRKVDEVRPGLLRWGFGHAFGRRPIASEDAFAPAANEVIDYPELSIHQIVHCMDRDELRSLFMDESAAMEKVKAVRAMDQSLESAEHLRRELSNFPRDWLAPLLNELGIGVAVFEAYVADATKLSDFWHSVPSVDILFTLMLARDRNADAETGDNDARDLSFMRLALPYSNVVLAENLWSHVANSTGLAAKYGTTVIADLGLVPDLLREQGCL